MFNLTKARDITQHPIHDFKSKFGIEASETSDAIYVNTSHATLFGVSGMYIPCPIASELLKQKDIQLFFKSYLEQNSSIRIHYQAHTHGIVVTQLAPDSENQSITQPVSVDVAISDLIIALIEETLHWAGHLNSDGEHLVDLMTPTPGPHFHVNLLMGNRIAFESPLLTTPKSVVDRLGRGSFRSHAGTQVLATKWDYLPEENGFPANRQFYLVEKGEQIFYSADLNKNQIKKAYCKHGQNHTVITYETTCGLEIQRTIFLLPHQEGMPLATEVQRVQITNKSLLDRQIQIVSTGMLGTSAANALAIDVVYSTLIMQGSVLKTGKGEIAGLSIHNNPEYLKEDIRFHSMLIHDRHGVSYPDCFTMHYPTFVGSGSLERPAGLFQLNNQLSRKGPGFFALGKTVEIPANSSSLIDHFTGLVSAKCKTSFAEQHLATEVEHLLTYYKAPERVAESLEATRGFVKKYAANMKIQSKDQLLNAYFNHNLPFQVLYQTFVSRSFGWTQKGYREIGFREIQDIFASMYYFVGMGEQKLVKNLFKEWFENVYEAGYANHNFYWVGKEPGRCSDDALWLIQAVDRYVKLTGDYAVLSEVYETADKKGIKRTVFDTLLAIIHYSNVLSIGKHGLPLLDHSDWNDCLQLDSKPMSPEDKLQLYAACHIEGGGMKSIDTDQSESVMNAFLLKLGIDALHAMATVVANPAKAALATASQRLFEAVQQHCWKEDFFARVLFNRPIAEGTTYLGAGNDGLSLDDTIQGTYFINSFTWAVLSDSATEAQIATSLDTIERYLKTPYGIMLCTPVHYGKICGEASSAHYYQGDRENGAVFKHANMMAVSAMFKAAQWVESKALAARLTEMAYWAMDQALPYKTMDNPYMKGGNPRLCTQYNNSQTGEGIGPVLSGTSTWMILSMMDGLGIQYQPDGIRIDPLLRHEETELHLTIHEAETTYHIHIQKPVGFFRKKDQETQVLWDGQVWTAPYLPRNNDGKTHLIQIQY